MLLCSPQQTIAAMQEEGGEGGQNTRPARHPNTCSPRPPHTYTQIAARPVPLSLPLTQLHPLRRHAQPPVQQRPHKGGAEAVAVHMDLVGALLLHLAPGLAAKFTPHLQVSGGPEECGERSEGAGQCAGRRSSADSRPSDRAPGRHGWFGQDACCRGGEAETVAQRSTQAPATRCAALRGQPPRHARPCLRTCSSAAISCRECRPKKW